MIKLDLTPEPTTGELDSPPGMPTAAPCGSLGAADTRCFTREPSSPARPTIPA